jgi:prepilin-type N-terminal cleavage/methylation domain-containing protein
MKKAFTLIELIFVIVIIGLLASVAIPKFMNLTTHAKKSNIKSVITSVQTSIDEIHGKWIIDDNYNWSCGSNTLNSNGYPTGLDDGAGESKLFKCVLKVPIPSCGNRNAGCWDEYEDNKYVYKFTPEENLTVEYNATNGTIECIGDGTISVSECEEIIY